MAQQTWLKALSALLAVGLTWGTAGAATDAAATVTLSGAGATFPAPLYEKWFKDYQAITPNLHISYQAVGSGEGIRRFLGDSVDFGASDAALSDKELARVDPKRGVVMVPMTAGMVVLAYNVPGIGNGLVLKREVYRDIFAGRILRWNDPRIQAANPTLKLPDRAIIPVVRRESSGTTYVFTHHLGAVDPTWATEGPGIGKLVDWPGDAMTAKGNEGVARRIQITEGSIGYLEFGFAKRLGIPIATLENHAARLVTPTPVAGQAALASARDIPADLRLFLPDPAGQDAYPIVGYTWILLGEHYADAAKAGALKDTLAWALSDGQRMAADMGYVPLPSEMVELARGALAKVQ